MLSFKNNNAQWLIYILGSHNGPYCPPVDAKESLRRCHMPPQVGQVGGEPKCLGTYDLNESILQQFFSHIFIIYF